MNMDLHHFKGLSPEQAEVVLAYGQRLRAEMLRTPERAEAKREAHRQKGKATSKTDSKRRGPSKR